MLTTFPSSRPLNELNKRGAHRPRRGVSPRSALIPGTAPRPPAPPPARSPPHLLGGERGGAAVAPVVVAVGPVVDGVAPPVCLERLARGRQVSVHVPLPPRLPRAPQPRRNLRSPGDDKGAGRGRPRTLGKLKGRETRPPGLRNRQVSPVAPAPGPLWGLEWVM